LTLLGIRYNQIYELQGNFSKKHTAQQKRGVLVTYAARGVVKRSMIEVGFLEKLAGPPGKRDV
jgi:tRNA U34 5-methylaminomethyl-2-thiouridine-forming methyltransferase MnmC